MTRMRSLEGPERQEPAGQGIALSRNQSMVLVMDTPKGRGIFAGQDLAAHTLLDICPVLVLDPVENEKHIRKTDLYNYTYNWPYTPPPQTARGTASAKTPSTTQAIILGLGSMFNHSSLHQNVGWKRDVPNLLIRYTALRDIKKGEELCISYGSRLTFKDTDAEAMASDDEDENQVLRIELT
ncbi:hypothetical protein PVAG01_01195 [Phlyctema vagabunda]|uniref:SET domain-containing protein n=1 Tax=Phlyctema vagabunda TaxID=108571 RepID=A0ABR4PXU4_9HELO